MVRFGTKFDSLLCTTSPVASFAPQGDPLLYIWFDHRAMDPRDRVFMDEVFAIEMEALADAAAAEPGRGVTFPPSRDGQRRMRYRYFETVRMWRDTEKVETQLQHKFGAAWPLVLEYLGCYFLALKRQLLPA